MAAALPIRLRLTLAFVVVMAVLLAATGLFVDLRLRSDLDRALDSSLRSRAGDVAALVEQADTGLRDAGTTAVGGRASGFAQIIDPNGRVFDATRGLPARPLLSLAQLAAAGRGPLRVPRIATSGLPEPARLLAVPVAAQGRRLVIVVGASLAPRDEALSRLRALLLLGGPAALLLASLAGYALAAAALRPVEAMRARAAAISAQERGQRLPLGRAPDELQRLGATLNAMLERLELGLERERAFAADAGHELRTPLTILRTELELIGREQPSGAALERAVSAAVAEADRLARLLDDLLALARSESDRIPVQLDDVAIPALLEDVRERACRAGAGVPIAIVAAGPLSILADRARLEQALGNLVDNSLRHGAGPVELAAQAHDDTVELHVRDSGPGFEASTLPRAFERFARGGAGTPGSGIGLAIVAAIARSHGGTAHASNRPEGGADVWVELPRRGAARGN